MQTTAELLQNALGALIAGHRLDGQIPSRADLNHSGIAGEQTIQIATSALHEQGYLTQPASRRAYRTAIPERLRNSDVVDRISDLVCVARTAGISHDDLRYLLAAAMLLPEQNVAEDSEPTALIAEAISVLRPARPPRTPSTDSAEELEVGDMTPQQRAQHARDELEAEHGY